MTQSRRFRTIVITTALGLTAVASPSLADTVELTCRGDNTFALAYVTALRASDELVCFGDGDRDRRSGYARVHYVDYGVKRSDSKADAVGCTSGLEPRSGPSSVTQTCRNKADKSRAILKITR